MKKFKHIFVCGLAVVASAVAVQAQTLTQDWKMTTGLPSAAEARDGIGGKGKIWTNDKSSAKLTYWDESGVHSLSVGAGGTAITMDDAGNIIISTSMYTGGCTAYKILPYGETSVKDLSVKLPDGVTPVGMQYIGRAKGDVMSAEGGVFYIGSTANAVKVFVAGGVQDVAKSKAITTGMPAGAETIVQPVSSSLDDDEILLRNRSQKNFYYWNGEKYVAYSAPWKANSTCGGDAFKLNGTLYTIEPSGADYVDGFVIVDRSTNKVVATHEAEFATAARKPNGNSLTAEKVDEYTINIYQYVPGQMVAKYTFSLPKMYILGQNEVGDAWNPTSGIAMTWESGNVWSATVTTAPGRENLGFVSVLAENNDEGGWTYVNGNRWGLGEANQEGALAEKLTVSKNENSVNVGVGTFFIRMNLDDNTLYIAPTKLYVIGTSNKAEGHHWASDDDSYMAESNPETPGVFTFDPIDLKVEGKAVGEEAEEDLAYFAFVTGIDAEWGPVNNSRWCPDNKDGELTDNTDFTDFGKYYDGAFMIKNGAYKLTVDLNTKTVKAVYLTSSGVEQVGAEAAGVIAADGQIRIVGDAATVSVYNAAGQAVAINSAERTFAVARGMYVVVVDGKATKVVVR